MNTVVEERVRESVSTGMVSLFSNKDTNPQNNLKSSKLQVHYDIYSIKWVYNPELKKGEAAVLPWNHQSTSTPYSQFLLAENESSFSQ